MDPVTGTFVSVDPITRAGQPQRLNAYSYANNNPISLTDPLGLEGYTPGQHFIGRGGSMFDVSVGNAGGASPGLGIDAGENLGFMSPGEFATLAAEVSLANDIALAEWLFQDPNAGIADLIALRNEPGDLSQGSGGAPSVAAGGNQGGGFWRGVGKFLLDEAKGIAGMVIGTPYLLGRGLWGIGRGIVTGDFSSIRGGLLDITGAALPKYGAFTGLSWPGTASLSPISWVVNNTLDAGASQWHDGQVLTRSSAQFGWMNRAWTGGDGRAGVGDLAIGPYGQAVRAVGTAAFGTIGLAQLGFEALP
jgi:hypothetical protein